MSLKSLLGLTWNFWTRHLSAKSRRRTGYITNFSSSHENRTFTILDWGPDWPHVLALHSGSDYSYHKALKLFKFQLAFLFPWNVENIAKTKASLETFLRLMPQVGYLNPAMNIGNPITTKIIVFGGLGAMQLSHPASPHPSTLCLCMTMSGWERGI